MNSGSFAFVAISAVLLFGGGSPAFADTASANCEVRKGGDTRKGATGPCTFSQRQGYISLQLKNGNRYPACAGRPGRCPCQQRRNGTEQARLCVAGHGEDRR